MNQREALRNKTWTRRSLLIAGGQGALFSALLGRLYYLQVVEADKYTMLAEDNRISLKLLAPPRGRLFDRFGEVLATNGQTYRAVVVLEQARDIEATLDALSRLIEVGEGDRRRVYRELKRKRAFVPIVVRDNLDWAELAKIEVNAPDLPGVSIDVAQTRFYPHTEAVGHLLGYVGAVSEAELVKGEDPLLELPDFRIGKNGVEKLHDLDLRGKAGSSQVEVNAVGRVVRELARDDGTPGKDVRLTIDIGLQEFARQRIGEESAACVVMEIHSGEVLAMVAAPAFDPNLFSAGLTARDWEALLADPKNPLTNKAIAGHYAPGSTFKMITALAGIEAGVVTPNFDVFCTGKYPFGNTLFHCWKKQGHGRVGLHNALKFSCDTFFYEVSRRVGIDRLAQMARQFGFGEQVGIDLPGEKPGVMPDRAWKQNALGQAWAQGETLSCGIGQSYVTATPLQLCVMAARLANGGFAVVPHVTQMIGGEPPPRRLRPPFPQLTLARQSLPLIHDAMNAVVNEGGGTAFKARIQEAGFEMAGKTGSAQVRRISLAERERGLRKQEELPWKERDNALFVAYAPVAQPRYACAVVVEHGAHGSTSAAPIARDVLLEAQRRNSGGSQPPAAPGPVAGIALGQG